LANGRRCIGKNAAYQPELEQYSIGHYQVYESLHEHRTGPVRSAARHNLLAYGFLRGKPYQSLKAKCRVQPNWKQVYDLVLRFSEVPVDRPQFDAWYKVEVADQAA